MLYITHTPRSHIPWNKGKLIGQRPPLKLREIWAVRIRLQLNVDLHLKLTQDLHLKLTHPGRQIMA